MTPADQYVQKRAEAVALIEQHAPPRLQSALIELLRPAIALCATRAEDAQIPLGASKFGGAPDVPEGFEWPTWKEKPLGFLAQINLEEVAPFDVEGLLPKGGLLSFFYFTAGYDWPDGKDGERTWQVFHFDASVLSRVRVPQFALDNAIMSTGTIQFSPKWTVIEHPYYITGENNFEGYSEDETNSFWELKELINGKNAEHQMLGHPRQIQDDARYTSAYMTNRDSWKEWQLLLQIGEDEENLDFMWGDSGAMFFTIHQDDFARTDFSRVQLIADCY